MWTCVYVSGLCWNLQLYIYDDGKKKKHFKLNDFFFAIPETESVSQMGGKVKSTGNQ